MLNILENAMMNKDTATLIKHFLLVNDVTVGEVEAFDDGEVLVFDQLRTYDFEVEMKDENWVLLNKDLITKVELYTEYEEDDKVTIAHLYINNDVFQIDLLNDGISSIIKVTQDEDFDYYSL